MIEYSTLPDDELLGLLVEEDHAAFTEIYLRYWHLLFLHSCKILQDQQAAQDVIQDLFTRLWNKEELNIEVSLKSYLYKMCRNLTLNAINHQKIKERHLDALAALLAAQDSRITEQEIRFKELSEEIERGAEFLPPRMRTIFNMSRRQGISHKDIAFQLDVSVNTVKSTMNRALKILRSRLTSFLFF